MPLIICMRRCLGRVAGAVLVGMVVVFEVDVER
jgi:hypothetical protein